MKSEFLNLQVSQNLLLYYSPQSFSRVNLNARFTLQKEYFPESQRQRSKPLLYLCGEYEATTISRMEIAAMSQPKCSKK